MESEAFRGHRAEGYDALYNMDYAEARAAFERLAKEAPEHPAGCLYQATTLWLETLNKQRRLRSSLYSGLSFFAKTADTPDPKTDARLRSLAQAAIDRSEAVLKRQPREVDALYFKGLAHGLIGSWEATVNRSFFSALRNGLKSYNIHRQVLELDPDYTDAHLTTGTYNYIVGSLPFFVKILAAIGGYHGSREEGLAELRRVVNQGRLARDDARVALLTFYPREKKYKETLEILDYFAGRYPRNYIFRLEMAGVLLTLNRPVESRRLFESMITDPSLNRVSDLVQFQYAEALVQMKAYSEALEHFQSVTRQPGAAAELVSQAHLGAGRMLDLLRRREEAKAEYRIVLGRGNVFDSHELAKEYLDKPYRGEN